MTQPPSGPQPPYGSQPPSGPQPPYGSQPYPPQDGGAGAQQPYGQQYAQPYGQQPGYGAGGPGYQQPQPEKGNGCLIAGIIAAAVAVLATAGLVVLFLVVLDEEEAPDPGPGTAAESPEGGETTEQTPQSGPYTVLPECAVGEHGELSTFVPDYRADINEPIDTDDQAWWEGTSCSWTNAGVTGDGDYATLTILLNDVEALQDGTYSISDDLDWHSESYLTETVPGLGEDAVSWYDSENEFGCVAAYDENLSFSACYDTLSGGEPLPEAEAIANAEQLARASLEAIQNGDYR
ncbi:hypothetical protein [Actinorugispora endophytica]|uniref:Uncharacterized protein n=1 Tax=Actinorugispora endophytica TaxID=1605990 RepID=A0A4R6UN43_9ACTN|nr:hypothetical protein [Actinorugispora endophytica]TDQ48202.1 hypothetical protein EV190_11916 [Actinorugispora endophytica]